MHKDRAKKSDNKGPWGGVLALSLAAFALVASEFMPVSLLTPIAASLHVTEGQAGQAISVSGASALLTSLFITAITRRLDRKVLLLGLTLLMMVSGSVVAFAPNYLIFVVGRALIGVAIGGFWSMSAATAMRLVSEDQISRALAVVNGGNALATVIAAPLGSFLGSIIGWRGAFFCVVPIAAVAFGWKLVRLPSMKAGQERSSGNVLRLLRRPPVACGMIAVSAFFMGQFTLFTYLRPFLESVTRVGISMLSVILLIVGAAGVLGTVLIGKLLDRGIYRTLIGIPILMSVIALTLIKVGSSLPFTTTLLGIWGLVATAAPVGWWTWLARTLPHDAEAGGGLMVAVVQLAIGLGATLGGFAFDAHGYRLTFGISSAILLAAAVLATVAAQASSRSLSRESAELEERVMITH